MWRWRHGRRVETGFPGWDERAYDLLPGIVGCFGLRGVDRAVGVVILFWPDVADVMRLWTVVLCEDVSQTYARI